MNTSFTGGRSAHQAPPLGNPAWRRRRVAGALFAVVTCAGWLAAADAQPRRVFELSAVHNEVSDPAAGLRQRAAALETQIEQQLRPDFQAGPKAELNILKTRVDEFASDSEKYSEASARAKASLRNREEHRQAVADAQKWGAEATRSLHAAHVALHEARKALSEAVGRQRLADRARARAAHQAISQAPPSGTNASSPADAPTDGSSSGPGASVPGVIAAGPGDARGGRSAGTSDAGSGGQGSRPSNSLPPITEADRVAAGDFGIPARIYKDLREANPNLQYIVGFQRGFNERVETDLIPSIFRMTFAAFRGQKDPLEQTAKQDYTRALEFAVRMMGDVGTAALV